MYGKILKIDLTNSRVSEESIPDGWPQRYLGGAGINDRLLWEHFLKIDPHIDPLSPDNVLISGVGPLGATGVLGAGTKTKWTFKSPIYHGFGDSAAGGFWGCHLRWAGYDHIVITGRASKPVYLWINNDRIEIRDAGRLWGKDVFAADSLIKDELGSPEVSTALISQAGENLVRFASISLDRERMAARTGGGCVMGSKNLKAIAVRGTKGVRIADPVKFFEVTDESYRLMNRSRGWEQYAREGTPFLVRLYQLIGAHPWHNHQFTQLPPEVAERVGAGFFLKNFKTCDTACAAGCATACSQWWRIKGDESPAAAHFAGEVGEKPEFGILASCFAWGADDLATILHFQRLWNKYAIDAMEIGESIALLMELNERGIISEKDVAEWAGEPLKLDWGDYETAEKITGLLVNRKSKLADMVSEGVYRLAERIGELKGTSVMKYCKYGNKHAPEIVDVRNRRAWTLMMATATRGADHLKALSVMEQTRAFRLSQELFDSPDGANSQIPYLKGAVVAWDENRTEAMHCTGLCLFNTQSLSHLGYKVDTVAKAYEAVTGMTPEDLMLIGERTYNLERAFNARLGFSRKDDTLCQQWLKEPVPAGSPGEGMKGEDFFELMLDEYYKYRGIDPENGLQTRGRLEGLGLKDVADVLESDNALSLARPSSREDVLREAIKRAEEFKAEMK